MKKKPCSICHLPTPLSQFNKNKQSKDGLNPYCRACSKKKWLKYKEYKGPRLGFSQEDARPVRLSPEEKFQDIFGSVDYYISNGKCVMKDGKVLDEKWYQKKLRHLTKRPSSAIMSL